MDVNLGLSEGIHKIISNGVIAMMSVRALVILALAIMTFKILDIFLEKNIRIAKHTISQYRLSLLLVSLILIGSTMLPLISAGVMLWSMNYQIGTMFWLIISASVLCIFISAILRSMLPKGDPRKKGLVNLLDAVNLSFEIIAENLAYWLQSLIVGSLNLVLNIMRAPFISYYVVTSTVINFGLSFIIVALMGSSQIAGEANIIASLIGGIAHAIIRKDRIKELREELERGNREKNNNTTASLV